MKRLRGNNTGSILVFVAASLVGLIGMSALAVDVGRLYAAKARGQDICDASAISGGRDLDGSSLDQPIAQSSAANTAVANQESRSGWPVYSSPTGGSSGTVSIEFPTKDGEVWEANGKTVTVDVGRAIRVKGWVEVQYGLASIFGGASSSRAAATAIARMTPPPSVEGVPVAPMGPLKDDVTKYTLGSPYTIKIDDWNDDTAGYPSSGNFLLVDLSEGAQPTEKEQIVGSSDIEVGIGDHVYTKPGNSVGQVMDLAKRIAPSAYKYDEPPLLSGGQTYVSGTNFSHWQADKYPMDARVVVLPVFDAVNKGGHTEIVISGFAVFFIDHYDPKEGEKTVTGYFVEAVYTTNGEYQFVDWLNGDKLPHDGSLYVIKLVA